MWDRVLQVLSGTRRFSLLLKALKAFGLCSILSLYITTAIIIGDSGSSIVVNTVVIDRGSIICVVFSRHGVFVLLVLGNTVNVIV